jgi:hypothetical protein
MPDVRTNACQSANPAAATTARAILAAKTAEGLAAVIQDIHDRQILIGVSDVLSISLKSDLFVMQAVMNQNALIGKLLSMIEVLAGSVRDLEAGNDGDEWKYGAPQDDSESGK